MTKLAAVAALASHTSAALAQAPVTRTETKEHTATIVAVNHTARKITLKTEHGTMKLGVGPEVKRFDELRVGDQITFRYQESVLAQIAKPGQAASGPVSDKPVISRGTGHRPSATVTHQQKATVTLKAIDENVPAVTVTADGEASSFKVHDKQMLIGFKVGDEVEIVYTEALMISVK